MLCNAQQCSANMWDELHYIFALQTFQVPTSSKIALNKNVIFLTYKGKKRYTDSYELVCQDAIFYITCYISNTEEFIAKEFDQK